jgi:uncharacterized protein YcbX
MPYRVTSLRRYPVKSMGGESLDAVDLDRRGIVGDRWFAVQDEQGRFASGKATQRFRRRDAVFDYRAVTTSERGVEVRSAGGSWRVGDPALDAELSSAMGSPVRVTPEADVPHQDAGSVSLVGTASLAWCAARFGVDADPRRLRVNMVFESDEPFIEDSWVGQSVRIGATVLTVARRVERCRTIDVAQDGAEAQQRWLEPLGAHRDLRVAIYADVTAPGRIGVGDAVWAPARP